VKLAMIVFTAGLLLKFSYTHQALTSAKDGLPPSVSGLLATISKTKGIEYPIPEGKPSNLLFSRKLMLRPGPFN
jgi:hypothetical protein